MIPVLLRAGSYSDADGHSWLRPHPVPGIERHFHSARIPATLVLLGNALVAVDYYIVFLALQENRWAASIIEVLPGQSVISTGPYGVVPTECFWAVY
jgi:hypothetical protein